jgi:hypothetical protein
LPPAATGIIKKKEIVGVIISSPTIILSEVFMRQLLLSALAVLAFCLTVSAQVSVSEPKRVVEDFYGKIWLNPDSGKEYEIYDRSEKIKEYISGNLHKKLQKLYKIADGDYFLNWSGDYTPRSIKIVKISDAEIKGSRAFVTASFQIPNTTPKPGEGEYFSQTMKISLLKEKGVWKIDEAEEMNL